MNQIASTTPGNRTAIAATYGGLALTVLAIVVLFADHVSSNGLAAHIWHGYPSYTRSEVDAAAMIWVIYLSILGGLGIIGWLTTSWAVGRGKRWARWLAAGLFVTGTSIALFNLLVRDTSGETGLSALLGWTGLLPSLAGLIVVIMLWRRR